MTRPRRSMSSRVAAEAARLLYNDAPFREEYPHLLAFFDLHREDVVRKILPQLQSDGNGGFVTLCPAPNARRMHLVSVHVNKDFRAWRSDDGAFGGDAYSLLSWLRGPNAPLMFLGAAAARILLPEETRA